MTRTIIRPGSTARATALGALVIGLAVGCGAAEDGTAPSDDPGASQEGGEDSSDGGAADGGSDGSGSDDGGGSTDPAQQESAATALPAEADLATEEPPVTAERAVEIATEAAGGGDLVQIEIDHDARARAWEWQLEVVQDGTQHELDIDATTGEITEHETDTEDDQDPVVDVTSPMTYSEAIEIAIGQEPGRVSGWSLDSDDGTIRYQIDIDRESGGDVEVEVDVETGDVRVED